MPDYTELRERLENELAQLVDRAKHIDADLSEPGNDDWEERATETEGDEVLAGVGNLTLQEIEQIKHALHQIDTGTYGICTRCKVSIPKARLEAIPYATTCMACS